MNPINRKKDYPLNYPADVLNVISGMAFKSSNVVVAGSMSLRSQQYAGDYDMIETVELTGDSLDEAAIAISKQFQKMVAGLTTHRDTYVGDIKWGEMSEWRVVEGDVRNGRVVGYDAAAARAKLTSLTSAGVISTAEAAEMRPLLVSNPSPVQFLTAQQEIKPQVVRWSVKDVAAGFVLLRNGRRFTLADGVRSKGMCKLDVVGFVQRSRFTDFSIIYTWKYRGTIINPLQPDPAQELRKNIATLAASGDYFKMAKRIFALVRGDDAKLAGRLTTLFNGDMGRLYAILSDIGTILFLLENERAVPLAKIQYQVGQFRSRLGNIFETDRVNTERILDDVLSLESADKTKLRSGLERLADKLLAILNRVTGEELRRDGLLPLPKRFMP